MEIDALVRQAGFAWLDEQTRKFGNALPYRILKEGFSVEGRTVPLVGPQGIFKPAILPEIPLTIMTAAPKIGRPAPYDDELTSDGLLIYRYRGTDPRHRDNVGLRGAYETATPLIYLYGVAAGEYEAAYPVYVVGDDPAALTFVVDVAPAVYQAVVGEDAVEEIPRAYKRRMTLQRLHQARFRRQVIAAYGDRCAICRLRRVELLDAAHILPDRDPRSRPIVPNGLSLCTLHHPAFDRHVIGIRPDLVVEVRADVLTEEDGPMLIHGLQGFHGATITVPRTPDLRPDTEYLEERYSLFREVG